MTGQAMWVTVDFNNPPKKPGGKYGSIKTREAGYISVSVADLPNFIKGRRYCVEIEETAQGYKNFVRFANTPPSQNYGNGGAQSAQYPATQQPPARHVPRFDPPPTQQSHSPSIRAVQAPMGLPLDPTALNIFVTGVVGRAIGSGHFQACDIAELTREARAAFITHMQQIPQATVPVPTPKSQYVDPEFNDPLPPIDLTQRSDERYYQPQEEEDRIPF